jgi:anti-sigma factor RsiW
MDHNEMRKSHLQLLPGGQAATCAALAAQLAAWADDGLTGAAQAEVEAHVAQCRSCAAEARELRNVMARLRDAEAMAQPLRDDQDWLGLHAAILAETVQQASPLRRWWQRPAVRWAGVALAASLLVGVVGLWRHRAQSDAETRRAVFGSASEVVTQDRAFIDDLTASDDDPLNTLDALDELDDIDLDALGTALDEEGTPAQGA